MKFLSALFFLIGLLVPPTGYATQIVVGQVAPLTGRDANQGLAYGAGMQLLFSQVNKSGGVNGHTFSLVRKDDAGRPAETLSITAQLLTEENPLVLAGYFGNLNVKHEKRTWPAPVQRLVMQRFNHGSRQSRATS